MSLSLSHTHCEPQWPEGSLAHLDYVGFVGEEIEAFVAKGFMKRGSKGSWLATALCETPGSHSPDEFYSAADFVLAQLLPELCPLVLAYDGGSIEPSLDQMIDKESLSVVGGLVYLGLLVVRIAAKHHARLDWDQIRHLVRLNADEFDEILVYPNGLPENAMLQIALASSDDIVSVSYDRMNYAA